MMLISAKQNIMRTPTLSDATVHSPSEKCVTIRPLDYRLCFAVVCHRKMLRFFGKRSFDRPSRSDSCADGDVGNSGLFCPLGDVKRYPIKPKMHVVPEVISLFSGCSPVAVFWRVRAAVISAVNAVHRLATWVLSVRSISHVSKKVFKGVNPTTAHDNAPTAIQMIVRYIWVTATACHRRPRSILRRVIKFTPSFDRISFRHSSLLIRLWMFRGRVFQHPVPVIITNSGLAIKESTI